MHLAASNLRNVREVMMSQSLSSVHNKENRRESRLALQPKVIQPAVDIEMLDGHNARSFLSEDRAKDRGAARVVNLVNFLSFLDDRLNPVFLQALSRVSPPPYTEINIHEENRQKEVMSRKNLAEFQKELLARLDQ